jgi:hypothetical protein
MLILKNYENWGPVRMELFIMENGGDQMLL